MATHRTVWVLALACLALGLASTSSEVQMVNDMAEATPDPLQEAMDIAANKTAEIAVKAAKASAHVQEYTVAAANPDGIPQHVVDALKKENIVMLIRAALEKRALSMEKSDDPDEKAEGALNKRISKATEAAMQNPKVLETARAASAKVVKADIKKIEAISDMKTKVEAKLKKSVHQKELFDMAQAKKVERKDKAKEQLLENIQGELSDEQSKVATRKKISAAEAEINKENDFINSNHKAREDREVKREAAVVMAAEETKLKGQMAANAEVQVETGLAGKVAKEAQAQLMLKMAEIRAEATRKVEAELAQEAKDNKPEKGQFTMAVALDKVTNYWARRRRFARQKKFVLQGTLDTPEKSPEEEAEDKTSAEVLVKKHTASEEARLKALREKRIEAAVQKMLPKGGVKALVKKLALKSSDSEAESLADPTDQKVEVKAVGNAVAEVVREQEKAADAESKKDAKKAAQANEAEGGGQLV